MAPNNDFPNKVSQLIPILGLWGVKKSPQEVFWLYQFAKIGLKWHVLTFLRIFCIYILDLNKWHQGLVNVIKQNGHMLPLSYCARNKNSTLFLYQTRWLLFFTFSWTPCMFWFNGTSLPVSKLEFLFFYNCHRVKSVTFGFRNVI